MKNDIAKCVFFWSACKSANPRNGYANLHKGCLSQWQECSFEVDGVSYSSAEQFMMAEKARKFGDGETLARILSAKLPRKIKALGREVKSFDGKKWDSVKFEVVVRGNMAKFSQNRELLSFLLGTGDATLVEASPEDKIWGVGLKEEARDILDPDKWQGENLLGKALMEVRSKLAATKKEAKEIMAHPNAQFKVGQKAVTDINALRMHYARQEARRGISHPPNNRRDASVARSVTYDLFGPRTDKRYVEELKASVESSHQYISGKDERRVEIVNQAAVEKFARLYKPYVFGVLKSCCFFGLKDGNLVNGTIEADDVFNEVLVRFLQNKELKNLDLFDRGGGRRPFRNYLRAVTQNVFYTMIGKDLVDEIGSDGKPVMVPEVDKEGRSIFDTDEKGIVKMDGSGHPIFKMKPNRVLRLVALEHIGNLAWGSHMPKMWAQLPSNKQLQNLLLDILTIAYVSVHERKEYRNGWAYDAMAAIFERGEDDKTVVNRLMQEGVIKRVNTFEAAKSRFADKWHDAWMDLYRRLFKSKAGLMMEDEFLVELWRKAKERLGKARKVDKLRAGIAEWAFDYAERAMRKGAKNHGRHRY